MFIEGLKKIVDFYFTGIAAIIGTVKRFDPLVHIENRIHRAFHRACHIPGDIDKRFQVLPVDRLFHYGFADVHQFTQRNERTLRRVLGPQRDIEQFLDPGTLGTGQFDYDRNRFLVTGLVE